jgi:hypothetical protein
MKNFTAQTFKAYTNNSEDSTILFTVLTCEGCLFNARKLAMDECDRQGWTLIKAVWM